MYLTVWVMKPDEVGQGVESGGIIVAAVYQACFAPGLECSARGRDCRGGWVRSDLHCCHHNARFILYVAAGNALWGCGAPSGS